MLSSATNVSLRASSLWRRGGKESLQLRLWNLNSTSNSPVAPRRLSFQIFANQREAKTSANVNKHWKTRAKGNDVITNAISANQHFASTFSMQIFKFQRRSCKLSFLFAPRRQSAPETLLAGHHRCENIRRLVSRLWGLTFSFFFFFHLFYLDEFTVLK